ncbi:MAG: M48 family metalloprotease [Bacteroidales bacterium]|jgi:hypothetical protein|nr:M48 family metalloprotease [Bacteroidales bacterium]
MRKLFLFWIVVCLNYCLFCQNIGLLDTLSTDDKEIFFTEMQNRKDAFLKNLSINGTKSEQKEVKSRFDKAFSENLMKDVKKDRLLLKSLLNTYLNGLLSEIKKANPEISEDILLLVDRSYIANAYNFGDGTIVIYNYLLNCLQNEDQLVFVICHEIAHRQLEHSVNTVLARVRSDNSSDIKDKTKQLQKQRYGNRTEAEMVLKDILYKNSAAKREQETQADSLGMLFFSTLGRPNFQVIKALRNLRDSDYERDSLTIKDYRKMFSDKSLNFNEKWFDMGDYAAYFYQRTTKFNTDSLRTHPNMDERTEKLKTTFPQLFTDSSTNFTKSEEYDKWQSLAMLQNVYNQYLIEQYGNSLYEALKLYNRRPSDFLKEMIGKNFTKLYEAQQKYRLNRYVSQVNVNEYTSSYNRFCTFIINLNLDELKTFSDHFSKK